MFISRFTIEQSKQSFAKYILILLFSMVPIVCFANAPAKHLDPAGTIIFWVTLIFFFGIVGRYCAQSMKQAGVLGELIIGILLGNILYYFGVPLIIILREGSAVFDIVGSLLNGVSLQEATHTYINDPIYANEVLGALQSVNNIELIKVANVLDIFSRYGVIFLLFGVGLESSIDELRHTGRSSIQVALIGVVAPMVLGMIVMMLLYPDASVNTKLYVAATLSATSVGITARVLKDMKKIRTREARTILGAAMIDDILGLVILAVVSSIVLHGAVHIWDISKLIIHATLFLGITVLFGPLLIKKAIKFFKFLELWEAKLIISFLFIMLLAWFATQIQLATIIGAFAAGVIIHDGFFDSHDNTADNWTIKMLVTPLESILAPLFFVLIGIQVKLESFLDFHVLLIALALVVAAVIGKFVSGYGASKKDDKWLIGIGMLPRGEVGLVFASIGRTLGVMTDQLFSAIILMVFITTLITPPLLRSRYASTG